MVTRLKLAREAREIRAYEIARAVGITRTQFSLIEGGHVLPVPWLAARIAEVIGLDARDLFQEAADEQGQDSPDPCGSCQGAGDPSDLRPDRSLGPAEAARKR